MNRLSMSATVLLAGLGSVALAATPAAATSVIGVGNGAVGNACANDLGSRARGATSAHPGTVSGLGTAVPLSGPANQCGNLGVPEENKAEDTLDILAAVSTLQAVR
ncbi:hypothetical protein [Embleya scabrispora]|uniref:hypothetical protein n=1 Tax=Embleya scabrispora TaxID=159449 RepID=UPI000C7B0A73|nr:hypothetical protein [Embleya scabrispora]